MKANASQLLLNQLEPPEMPRVDQKRLASLAHRLYEVVADLEAMFPGGTLLLMGTWLAASENA